MQHRPRKRFGQNFLQDQSIIEAILRAAHLKATDHVIEIGPGLGALTQPLLRMLTRLTAIEIDTNLYTTLSAMPDASNKLQLINTDALTVDYSQFGDHLRLIGNLPYNISTPLLLHLLDYIAAITDMHFMLQKEVVERLAAHPGTKAYGRLSVMMQYHCEVEHLFNVPASAFHPQPKVESAIIRLTPYLRSPYPIIDKKDLEYVVALAFAMRRKTLANNLKPLFNAASISALGIDPAKRPEQLTVMEYVQLAKILPK